MGASDVLEVFSIYGQAASSSAELSRILVKFPTADIAVDRTAETIPASGSVSFYLRLFNCKHAFTVPRDYKLVATPLDADWEEGIGLDMENYRDETKDNIAGANWVNATSNFDTATATMTLKTDTITDYGNDGSMRFTLVSTDGTSVEYAIYRAGPQSTGGTGYGYTHIQLAGYSTISAYSAQFKEAIESANGHAGKLTTTISTVTNTNDTITITQVSKGTGGNTTIPAVEAGDADALTINGGVTATSFTGGDGLWAVPGAVARNQQDLYGLSEVVTFNAGPEDLEVDVTRQVEDWLAGTYANNGFAIALTSSLEAWVERSDDDSFTYQNTTGSKSSNYTKKFFSRTSEFFYKRPMIEARWNSAKKDDRNNFYYSSSLAPQVDNLNTIYFYNYVRGKLQNIPDVGTGAIYVMIYSGNVGNNSPSTSSIRLPQGGGVTASIDSQVGYPTYVTGGHVSTGIYSASFALTGSRSSLTEAYDVWSNTAERTQTGYVQYHTGSIYLKDVVTSNTNPSPEYATTIRNLKSTYSRTETPLFRLFVREKNWNPNIYTKASSATQNVTIESGSFKVIRAIDNLDVVAYGTGSSTNELYTQFSYDVSGSYFDLDMGLLEEGYAYKIKLAYYVNNDWSEQIEEFKFRVE
jgi:hypothetical protein